MIYRVHPAEAVCVSVLVAALKENMKKKDACPDSCKCIMYMQI